MFALTHRCLAASPRHTHTHTPPIKLQAETAALLKAHNRVADIALWQSEFNFQSFFRPSGDFLAPSLLTEPQYEAMNSFQLCSGYTQTRGETCCASAPPTSLSLRFMLHFHTLFFFFFRLNPLYQICPYAATYFLSLGEPIGGLLE